MSSTTGWELGDELDLLAANDDESLAKIAGLIAAYGQLACFNADGNSLLIVRRYHPTLNCSPDDPDYQSETYVMGLAYFTQQFSSWMYLPSAYNYTAVQLQGNGPAAALTIITREHGDTKTTIQEMFRLLGNTAVPKPLVDEELCKRYAALRDIYVPPPAAIKITQTSITMAGIGTMEQSDFADWWTAHVPIPLFATTLPVTFAGYNPQDTAQQPWLPLAAQAMQAFLQLDDQSRLSASPQVLQNCHAYIDAVGEQDWNQAMAQIVEPAQIWDFVTPRHIMIEQHDGGIYVSLHCDCEWEQEHGLLLVYAGGLTLSKVSEQDGDVV